MGFDLSSVFAGGVAGLFSGIRDVVGAFKADPTVVATQAAKLAELEVALKQAELQAEVQLTQAQTAINAIEAGSADKFTSRWRPAAGWLGVCGLAYCVIVYPLLTWASLNFKWQTPPVLDTDVLVTILMGMLGLSGMRSYEKVKGVTK